MSEQLVNPVILKVFLYRNNYKDRLLIAALKDCAFAQENGSFYVKAGDLATVIGERFGAELVKLRGQPRERLPDKATSVYFLDQILKEYPRLRYLHVQVLEDEEYSRKTEDDSVNFDYCLVHAKMDLSSVIDPGFLEEFKDVFRATGVYDYSAPAYERRPYFEIFTTELVQKLEVHRAKFPKDSQRWNIIGGILPFFTNKLQEDDCHLLIVMER